jgi:hypothetical protein
LAIFATTFTESTIKNSRFLCANICYKPINPQLLKLCLHNQKQKIKELFEANVNQLPTSTSLTHCQQNMPNISMSKNINGTRSKS